MKEVTVKSSCGAVFAGQKRGLLENYGQPRKFRDFHLELKTAERLPTAVLEILGDECLDIEQQTALKRAPSHEFT